MADYLDDYADSFDAPVVRRHRGPVRSRRRRRGFVVAHRRRQLARRRRRGRDRALRDEPAVPALRRQTSTRPSTSSPPTRYRNPAEVPDGGVLVVGASATGVQLADELAGPAGT